MNIKITTLPKTIRHDFRATVDEKEYNVVIWTYNSSSKFQSSEITDSQGNSVDIDLEEKIMEKFDKEWETLTGK